MVSSTLSASRSAERLTPRTGASSRSAGRRSPALSSPAKTRSSMLWRTSSWVRDCRTGCHSTGIRYSLFPAIRMLRLCHTARVVGPKPGGGPVRAVTPLRPGRGWLVDAAAGGSAGPWYAAPPPAPLRVEKLSRHSGHHQAGGDEKAVPDEDAGQQTDDTDGEPQPRRRAGAEGARGVPLRGTGVFGFVAAQPVLETVQRLVVVGHGDSLPDEMDRSDRNPSDPTPSSAPEGGRGHPG